MGTKEASVQEFLDSRGFTRKRSGYRYLVKCIELAMEHPELSCQEMCERISAEFSDKVSPKIVYRNCTYSVANSSCHNKSTYLFILEAADALRKDL